MPDATKSTIVCTGCGATLCESEANYLDERPYCRDCYHERHDPVHNYCYKPDPVFFGNGPRYMGVELEVDDGEGDNDANARAVLDLANREAAHIYLKHDGSLESENSFEIVSHPCSLAYHMNMFPWPEILQTVIRQGYTSHQAGTCGLHVHVSRNAFGSDASEQDAAIARLLFFFEKHWQSLLKFSRRTKRQLEQWARRYGMTSVYPMEMLDHAKRSDNGRYSAVNLTNKSTIEFRTFRGTLRLNTFLATLQLVSHLVEISISLDDDEMRDLSWMEFVLGYCHEPELVQYLKERRLYANEPCPMEAEV